MNGDKMNDEDIITKYKEYRMLGMKPEKAIIRIFENMIE